MTAMNSKTKTFILSILLPILVGIISSILISDSVKLYPALNQPKLAPPSILLPIVWTILYILMGISAGIINTSNDMYANEAMRIYYIQLFLNFIWPIIFFNLNMYFAALIVLTLLTISVFIMIKRFYKINKTAALLQIPYLLWCIFALYLNFSVFILN